MRPLSAFALLSLLLPLSAGAVEQESEGQERMVAERVVTSASDSRNAKAAMAASGIFPGLGQLYNAEGVKTLVVFAWESYYLSVILREGQRADLYRRHAAALGEGETWNGLDYGELRSRFHAHEERQTDYVWYTGALCLASLLDAYVFAHLHGFETDPIRGRRAAVLPHIDPESRSVGLQLRFRY